MKKIYVQEMINEALHGKVSSLNVSTEDYFVPFKKSIESSLTVEINDGVYNIVKSRRCNNRSVSKFELRRLIKKNITMVIMCF